MSDKRTFTPHEQGYIEELFQHPGYELLLEYLHGEAARLTTALTRHDTDWDTTNRYRGELDGIAHFFPKHIQAHYKQSEKP